MLVLLSFIYAIAVLTVNDVSKICHLTSDASSKWYDIGLMLGVKDVILKIIERNNHFNETDCYKLMLMMWLRSHPHTVDDLAAALEQSRIGCQDIAKRCEQSL